MADPKVFIGLLIGGAVPFLFSALAINAVSRTAGVVVQEVRRQFADGKIMSGEKQPDHGPVIDICTAASLRELVTPALLAVLTPVIVGFGIGFTALGAFLVGGHPRRPADGQLPEQRRWRVGQRQEVHRGRQRGRQGLRLLRAAVIADTVGDPFKDTAGPALNPLIKVMNLVSLLVLPAIIGLTDIKEVTPGNFTATPNGTSMLIAVGALVVLIGAIAFSKRKKEAFGGDDQQFAAATAVAAAVEDDLVSVATPAASTAPAKKAPAEEGSSQEGSCQEEAVALRADEPVGAAHACDVARDRGAAVTALAWRTARP